MPELTQEDWTEIYYAVLQKLDTITDRTPMDDEDGIWAAHLNSILDKIGADGEKMYS